MGIKKLNLNLAFKAWGQILRGNKNELLRLLFDLARTRPFFTYVFVVSIVHPNWWSIIIIPISFWFNQLLIELFAQKRSHDKTANIITGLILHYENANPQSLRADRYLVSEYLEPDIYQHIERRYLKERISILGLSWSLNHRISIYHTHGKGLIFLNHVCYNIPPYQSYIFLTTSPNERTSWDKFLILHEVFHFALDSRTAGIFVQHCNKLYTVFLLASCFLFLWKDHPYLGTIGLIILWVSAMFEKKIIIKRDKLWAEISADKAAIDYLLLEEKMELYEDLSEYPSIDRSLTAKDNDARNDACMRYLKLSIEGLNTDNNIADDEKEFYFRMPMIGLIFPVIIIIIFAIYSNEITAIFTLITFVVTMIIRYYFRYYLRKLQDMHVGIKWRLENWQSIFQ